MDTSTSKSNLWILVILLLLAAWLSTHYINADALYFDERHTILNLGDPYVPNSVPEMIASMQEINAQHPPGYYLLLAAWLRLTGYSQAALRYLSVLAGLVGIAMTYRMTRALVSMRAALYAAALMTVTVMYIYYTHEIRMYMLYQPVTALMLWMYARIITLKRPVRRWEWAALILSVAGLIYILYFGIFLIAGLGLYHLLFVPKDRRWWSVCVAFVAAGMLFLPWIGIVVQDTQAHIGHDIATASALNATWLMVYLFANGNLLLAVAVIVMLALSLWVGNRHVRSILFIAAVGWIALLIINAYFLPLIPPWRARYYLIFWPLLALIVSAVMARIIRRDWIGIALLVGWFAAGQMLLASPEMDIYNNRERMQQGFYPPFPQMMSAFYQSGQMPGKNDSILAVSALELAPRNYEQTWVSTYYYKLLNTGGMLFNPRFQSVDEIRTVLDGQLVVWLVYNPDVLKADDIDPIVDYLETAYQPCAVLADKTNVYIQNYVQQPLTCQLLDSHQTAAEYPALDLRLASVETVTQDEQLFIGITWDAGVSVPLHQYSVSLKVYDAAGEFVAQEDYELPYGQMARHLTTFAMQDWPSGSYSVGATVYNWQTGDRLLAQAADGQTSEEITIAELSR